MPRPHHIPIPPPGLPAPARLGAVLAIAFAVSPAAQTSGLGQPLGVRIDVEAGLSAFVGGQARWSKCIGCARDRFGSYWVSAGHPDWSPSSPLPGKLARFDRQGTVTLAVDQPAAAVTSFGIRDLAYDGMDTIYAGVENAASNGRLLAFDIVSETFLPDSGWRCPTVAGQGSDVVRGLAYDPAGDSGGGTMWTCDFGPQLLEFDRTGAVRRTITIPGTNPLPYGLGLDAQRRTLWLFCLGDSTRTDARVVAIEIDIASGARTGSMCLGDMSVPSLGGFAGGCELYVDGGQPTLLLLAQADSDTMYEFGGRFPYGQSCGGRMVMSGDAAYAGNRQWSLGLRGSGEAVATLLLHPAPGALPMPVPLFAPGCTLLLGAVPAPLPLPPVAIVGGSADTPLPVPGVIAPATLFFQWVELSTSVTPPIRMSDGGMVFVGA